MLVVQSSKRHAGSGTHSPKWKGTIQSRRRLHDYDEGTVHTLTNIEGTVVVKPRFTSAAARRLGHCPNFCSHLLSVSVVRRRARLPRGRPPLLFCFVVPAMAAAAEARRHPQDGIISTAVLPHAFRGLFEFYYFNSVQNEMFETCYNTSSAVVVSAPTGSGKTVLFELCLLRLLRDGLDSQGGFTRHRPGARKVMPTRV